MSAREDWRSTGGHRYDEGGRVITMESDRLRVPGGWLYRSHVVTWSENGKSSSTSMVQTFVPDEGVEQ